MFDISKKGLKCIMHMFFIVCSVFLCFLFFTCAYAGTKQMITLNVAKKNMLIGDKFKLTADIAEDTVKTHTVVWKSNRPKTASVSRDGLVKAKKNGTAKITAAIKGTKYKAECTIKISKASDEIVHYANAGIEFDHPARLKSKKVESEDGSRIEFTDENGNLVFWYEQGEKWRVDMAQDQHAYEMQLGEKYKNIKIDKFKSEKINEIEMIKLVFHFTDKKINQKIIKYLMVSEYAFFDFNFINSEDEFVNSLIKTIHFINI